MEQAVYNRIEPIEAAGLVSVSAKMRGSMRQLRAEKMSGEKSRIRLLPHDKLIPS